MRLHLNSLAGILALLIPAAAAAGAAPAAQQPAQKAVPATPAQPSPAQTSAVPANPPQPATAVPDEPTTGQSTAPGQTQTTPGQSQTSPGQASQVTPATTGQTPSGQTAGQAQAQASQLTAATAADVKAGVSVYDQKGGLVGKVESVSARGAVVSTGAARAVIPVSSFAKGDKGLVMNMTKAELDAQAKKKSPK